MAGSGTSAKPIDVTDEQRAMEIEVIALTNIATCYLKLGEPRKTLEFCTKALTSNPNAWKAVLRKSEAQTMLGNYDMSRITLAEALKIAPDAASKSAIKFEKDKMNAAEKDATKLSNSKQKKAFAKMFENENLGHTVETPSCDESTSRLQNNEQNESKKPASV